MSSKLPTNLDVSDLNGLGLLVGKFRDPFNLDTTTIVLLKHQRLEPLETKLEIKCWKNFLRIVQATCFLAAAVRMVWPPEVWWPPMLISSIVSIGSIRSSTL